MNKKPRSDSKLDSLPGGKFLQLRDGLLGGWKYDHAVEWLLAECGVSSSLAALSAFYRRHCEPLVMDRRQLAAVKAETLVNAAGRTNWNTASLELVKQMTFEFLNQPEVDAKTAEKFLKLVLKADSQKTERDKLESARQTKAEAGLDALWQEVRGNRKAEALVRELQETLKK